MRVTNNMYQDSLVSQLNRLSFRQVKLQGQISSGKKVSLPEDDPSSVRNVVNAQDEVTTIKGYRQNISFLKDKISVIYNNLRSLKTVSDRANEIAISADDLKTPDDLRTYAIEINNLIEQTVQIVNSTYNGYYLFGGNKSQNPPVSVQRDSDGKIVSFTINTDEKTSEYEISFNLKSAIDFPVQNATGVGQRGLISDARTGADFLTHLISLRDHLLSGDVAAVSSIDTQNLRKDESHIILNLADCGARKAHLQAVDEYLSMKEQSLLENISRTVDVDITEAIVKLNQTQNAFAAALQTGAVIMNKTLLDYLR